MTELRGARTPRSAFVLALVAAALAAFAAGRSRFGGETANAPLPPVPAMAFWIGAWVGPPPLDRDPATWRRMADAGFDVSMGPLEDRYRRADNVARLAFLDTTRALRNRRVTTFVRDDSLHPDETRRPGWEARVAAIVAAYGGARSLAGYFLADEPRPGDTATWAPLARLLRRLDPAHPAFVNFVGVLPGDAGDAAARGRWREAMARSVRDGELALFTVDAYPFGVDGMERPHFLATLQDAAAVSQRTGRPFGVVLQWTGHGELKAPTAAEARYQASQALAHGASCVIWFTYWTPNPDEEPWRWHDGAVAYDGTPTARLDTLTAINAQIRFLRRLRGGVRHETAHFGGELPAGLRDELSRTVPGMVSVDGGPCTIGLSQAATDDPAMYYLVASRDRARERRITVQFDSTFTEIQWWSPLGWTSGETASGLSWTGTLEPGGATVIRGWRPPPPPAARPRTPSPPGTR